MSGQVFSLLDEPYGIDVGCLWVKNPSMCDIVCLDPKNGKKYKRLLCASIVTKLVCFLGFVIYSIPGKGDRNNHFSGIITIILETSNHLSSVSVDHDHNEKRKFEPQHIISPP